MGKRSSPETDEWAARYQTVQEVIDKLRAEADELREKLRICERALHAKFVEMATEEDRARMAAEDGFFDALISKDDNGNEVVRFRVLFARDL